MEGWKIRQAPWKGLVYLAAGLLLIGWLANTPAGFSGKARAVGYAVCHQIDGRTFHIGNWAFPLCARCTGMYLGAVLGLAYQSVFGRRRCGTPPWRVIGILAVLLGLFGIDGVNSYLHFFPGFPTLYEPQNWLRLVTGTGMGLVISAALFPSFNQTIWSGWDARPAITGLRSLFGLLLLAAGLVGLVLGNNPVILYPLAFISAGGVLLLLTMIYSIVVVMVIRKENQFQHWNQLLLPLTAGFTLALLQISALDIVRFFFTGTWSGFHLG